MKYGWHLFIGLALIIVAMIAIIHHGYVVGVVGLEVGLVLWGYGFIKQEGGHQSHCQNLLEGSDICPATPAGEFCPLMSALKKTLYKSPRLGTNQISGLSMWKRQTIQK